MELTHFDEAGNALMVDVSEKAVTARTAVAEGYISVNAEIYERIKAGTMKKGDVLAVAQLAAIMGAKKTSDLIPLCHPLMLSKVAVICELDEKRRAVRIEATVKTSGQTGVEMEALTAASVAALTIYDMCKAVQKDMVIGPVRLLAKSGGKSGDFKVEADD